MNVQVCDFRAKDFRSQFIKSLENTGFAVLTNHGISHESIKEASMAWRLFFLADEAHRISFINSEDPNMGYKGMKTETAVGAKKADLKQFFHWKPNQVMPREAWAITQDLFYGLEAIGMRLLEALDLEGPRKDYEESCWASDNTLFRALHYPALDFTQEPGAVRAAAHEDINAITLLVAASSPGLEVLDLQGNWHSVPHEADSIVVNTGDMVQLASGGKYKSTTHRVVNPQNSLQDRISMPLFISPHGNTQLSPEKTAKQYLAERLAQIYGDKK